MAVTKGRLCGQNGCQSTFLLEDTPIAVLLRQVLGAIAQSVTQRYNCNLRG
jgi:hypothetical protein